MIGELTLAGWRLHGDVQRHDDIFGQDFVLEAHPSATLSLFVSVDELPAMTTCTLFWKDNVETEWTDEEIDVGEITTKALELTDEED